MFTAPDGLRRAAPSTFVTKTDATLWLTRVEISIADGRWRDPVQTRELFGSYAERWIRERPNLRPRTVDLYLWLYQRHLAPQASRASRAHHPQVQALCMAVPPRFSAFIAVTTFASLRWGEVTALHRRDVDLIAGVVTVRAAYVERSTGALELGLPKSRASMRTVALPQPVVAMLAAHLDAYVPTDPDALVFTGPTGRPAAQQLQRGRAAAADRHRPWRAAAAPS
jgi:hypothetical protein